MAKDPRIKSENDWFNIYAQVKIKAAGDCSAQVAKLQECFDKFDIPAPTGDKWFKLKSVQEGEYICIGTCAAFPHYEIDKHFDRDDKMNNM